MGNTQTTSPLLSMRFGFIKDYLRDAQNRKQYGQESQSFEAYLQQKVYMSKVNISLIGSGTYPRYYQLIYYRIAHEDDKPSKEEEQAYLDKYMSIVNGTAWYRKQHEQLLARCKALENKYYKTIKTRYEVREAARR